MEPGLRGKTAAITGGSKGIGFAVASEFAKEGVHLHLAARNAEEVERVARQLASNYGVEVNAHPADLSQRKVRDFLAHECANVDILVNCAGAIPGGGLDQVSEDAWRAAWDLKLFGYVGITRIIYETMCRHRRGVIINVVGTGGISTNAGYICGAANNAALINFTHSLGGASIRYGVRVCGVNPGPVETERMRYLRELEEQKVPPHKLEEWRKQYLAKMAYGRAARPDEVSGMVAFLASDRASYISGAMISIDGGLTARAGGRGVLDDQEQLGESI